MVFISSFILVFVLTLSGIFIYKVFSIEKEMEKEKNSCTCQYHYDNDLIISMYDFRNHLLRTTVVDFSDYDNDISGSVVVCDECKRGRLFYGDSAVGYYGKVSKLSSMLKEYNNSEYRQLSKIYPLINSSGLRIDLIRVGDRKDKTW